MRNFAEIELFWEIDYIPIYVNGKVVEWKEKHTTIIISIRNEILKICMRASHQHKLASGQWVSHSLTHTILLLHLPWFCKFISITLSRLNSINAIVVICFNCDTWEHSYEHFNKHWESRLSMHKQSGLYLTKDWQESKDHFGFYTRDGHVDAGKAPTANICEYICANIVYMRQYAIMRIWNKIGARSSLC